MEGLNAAHANYVRQLASVKAAAARYFDAVVDSLLADIAEELRADETGRPAVSIVRDGILLRDIDYAHACAVLMACGESPVGDEESILDRAKDLRLDAVLSRLCALAAEGVQS